MGGGGVGGGVTDEERQEVNDHVTSGKSYSNTGTYIPVIWMEKMDLAQ